MSKILGLMQDAGSDFDTRSEPVSGEPVIDNVQMVLEGDEPRNAAAYAFTPNGTQYAVCSTTQYGYKPASNSTWLTVALQSITAT